MKNLDYIIRNHAHYTDEVLLQISFKYYTAVSMIKAWWWGICIGRGTRFHGVPYFKRLQDSRIRVGRNCQFLSKRSSNKIGLSAPCILYTASKGAEIIIGEGCGFSGTRIWASKSVRLGVNVRCGANTLIMDSDAHPEDPRAGKDAPVVIGDNVWLGANVTVLKGVHIGANSLVGAGSVVTKDVPANVLAAGNPCRVIRNLNIASL